MSEKTSYSPRSVSAIDPKSIKIGSHPPVTQDSIPPIGPSPEAPEQSNDVHHQATPAGEQLLDNCNIEVTTCNDSTERNTAPEHTQAYAKPSDPESPPDQSPGGKRRHYSNPLIKQIHCAVIAEYIDEPFTGQDIEQWMAQYDIRKGDGTKYKNFNASSFLSNSYIKKKNRTNRNSVWLDRRFNKSKGVYEYWFVD